MDDNKLSFFQYIVMRIKNKFKYIKDNGIRGSWRKLNNKTKETTITIIFFVIIIFICAIMIINGIKETLIDYSNNSGVIINIDNNSNSKIYKNNNNILIEDDYRTAEIIADKSLYIRKEPNSKSKILGTLPSDYMIQVSYEQNGWCKLYNNPGWISAKYIKYIN